MKPIRRDTRHPVTLFIGGGPKDDGGVPVPVGRTLDLSRSGVFIVTEARPPLGSSRRISLVWGDDIFFARAEVIRHADDGIGLRFLDADAGFINAVQEIIGDDLTLQAVSAPEDDPA